MREILHLGPLAQNKQEWDETGPRRCVCVCVCECGVDTQRNIEREIEETALWRERESVNAVVCLGDGAWS